MADTEKPVDAGAAAEGDEAVSVHSAWGEKGRGAPSHSGR